MRGRLVFGDPWETAETFMGLLPGDMQVRRLLGVVDTRDAEDYKARARRADVKFLGACPRKSWVALNHGALPGIGTDSERIMAWTDSTQVNCRRPHD